MIRQLRELTRMRVHVQQDRNRVINRMGRLLETVNLKLSSVASHIAGKSGRAMLAALASRPDPHFQCMLTGLPRKLEWLDAELARLGARLCEQMAEHDELMELLSAVSRRGIDMTQFATTSARAMRRAPANFSRAKHAKAIVICAGSSGLFYRIGARRGMKKAAAAVAHRILAIAWRIIRDRVPYREQRRDALDRRNPLRTAPAAEMPQLPPVVNRTSAPAAYSGNCRIAFTRLNARNDTKPTSLPRNPLVSAGGFRGTRE